MTREIKFRAKITHGENSGKWKYVVVGDDAIGTAFSEKSIYFNNEDCIKSTLGQFTGVKDKNGTEIYEGDKVEAWSAGSKGTFEIKWRQDGVPCWLLFPAYQNREFWYLKATKYFVGKEFISVSGEIHLSNVEGYFDDGITIIGNIHE